MIGEEGKLWNRKKYLFARDWLSPRVAVSAAPWERVVRPSRRGLCPLLRMREVELLAMREVELHGVTDVVLHGRHFLNG